MTQIEPDRRQALTGRTHCSQCGSIMLRMGPDFVCPSRVNPSEESCANNDINAYRLLRLVVTHIVNNVMTQPTVDRLKERVKSDAQEISRRFQGHLDQTEHSLADLHQREVTAHLVQAEIDEDEINDISNKRAALSYEARNARRELEAQEFTSDEHRVEANAKDVDTFLDEATPEHTIEFINNFVESVGVGPWSIDLNYRFPIPSREHPKGRRSYVIPRRGSDQTGIVDQVPEEPPEMPEMPATPSSSGRTDRNI